MSAQGQTNEEEANSPQEEADSVAFNQHIDAAIRNRRAVAVVDASVKERYIAAYWLITTLEESRKYSNNISSSNWVNGAIPAAEGLGLLNLIREINTKTKHISIGEIVIYCDNRKIIKGVVSEVYKESFFTHEASATISSIREVIQTATIEISIEYSTIKVQLG